MTNESILKIHDDGLKEGRIPIDIYKDKETTFLEMAKLMADTIKENNKNGRKTLFIVPLGPIGQYKYFAKIVNEERISLKDVTFINMDEYMIDRNTLISPDHKLSFRKIMYELCYDKIDPELIMSEKQRIFPSFETIDLIDKVIEEHGGVDICFGGIGITGHIAFNEPPSLMSEEEFKNTRTRVVKITEATRVVNSMDDYQGAYYFMPEYAITIGMKEILQAKKIRLYCFRDWHKSVIKRASFGDKSVSFPASLLQDHPDARIGISEEVASEQEEKRMKIKHTFKAKCC